MEGTRVRKVRKSAEQISTEKEMNVKIALEKGAVGGDESGRA